MEDIINEIIELYFQGYKLLDILHVMNKESKKMM